MGGFLWPMRPVEPAVLPQSPTGFLIQFEYGGLTAVIRDGRIWTGEGNEITLWKCFRGVDLWPKKPIHAELTEHMRGRDGIPGLERDEGVPILWAHDVMDPEIPASFRLNEIARALPSNKFWRPAPVWELPDWGEVNRLFETARAAGHDGLVLKERGSHYLLGEGASIESPAWLKLEHPAPVQ